MVHVRCRHFVFDKWRRPFSFDKFQWHWTLEHGLYIYIYKQNNTSLKFCKNSILSCFHNVNEHIAIKIITHLWYTPHIFQTVYAAKVHKMRPAGGTFSIQKCFYMNFDFSWYNWYNFISFPSCPSLCPSFTFEIVLLFLVLPFSLPEKKSFLISNISESSSI